MLAGPGRSRSPRGERCCDQLGWHPRMIWGDTYDQTIADHTPHAAIAPAGTTAWRQGCRCLDCREANRAAINRTKAARGSGRPRDPPSSRPADQDAANAAVAGQEHVMASDNFTVQVGNLTDDPELRFTQNGTPVANFRLAVTPRVREADGTWRDGESSFFKVNAWRDQAENVVPAVFPGRPELVLAP